jgi:hypothetical protein
MRNHVVRRRSIGEMIGQRRQRITITLLMPLSTPAGNPTLFIRREAYERVGLVRSSIDERFNLTPDEFRVEAGLIAVGPLYEEGAVAELIEALESAGLVYFDDFFEMSGNWPEWLRLFATG